MGQGPDPCTSTPASASSDLIGRLDPGSSSSLGAPERQPDISDGDSAQVLSAHDNYNNVDDRQSVWLPGSLAGWLTVLAGVFFTYRTAGPSGRSSGAKASLLSYLAINLVLNT